MKNFGKILLKYLIVGVILFIAGTVLMGYFKTKTFGFSSQYFSSAVLITVAGLACLLLYDLFKIMDGKGKKKNKALDEVTDTKGNKVNEFFNRDFITEKELETNKAYNYNNQISIRSCKKDGILVRAEEKGRSMHINFVKPIHTLCVGTTSSGKTSRFVVPSLQLMSMTASKPSFVITDPKGELYEKCANKFRKEGYDVKVLDLRNPYRSMQWNPLTYPYKMWHRSYNLDKEVKVHPPGDNPKNYNLIIQRQFDFNSTTWFQFNGYAYVDREVLETDMKVLAKKLQGDTYSALNDICTTVCPIESGKDPSWEKTARRLIHGVLMAMLEDSLIPELGLTEDKYTFYNVAKIVNTTDSGRDTYATLKKYLFDYRDKFSKVPELASTALQNAETTTKNYMGFATSYMSLFADEGISLMTSATEVDFVNMDEKPTAIFLIIPDEVRVRYPLAILFVVQLYKKLVEKAQGMGGELKRHVYFMLDEFGNMPKFPEFGSIMTVGRSRGIFFELCVQSYSQLYQVYGQDEGKIIKDNCPIQVYIASEDTTTNKEFSELLGKKTIRDDNENRTVGPDGKESKSYSTVTKSIPLAYPDELMSFRDQGKICVKSFEPNAALKTTVTPYYEVKSDCFDMSKAENTYKSMKQLREDEIFYDIKLRNSKLSSKNGANNDDEDDDFDLF